MKQTSDKNCWDKYWSKSNLLYNEKIVNILLNSFDIKNFSILEVGAGSGNTCLYLCSHGANVTLLDYSEEAIKLIKKNNKNNLSVYTTIGDAFHLPFKDNIFDLVFSQGLIEHYKNPLDIILEKKRVVKKGGHILVDVPQKYNFYTLKKKTLMFFNRWFAGWETSFSINELEQLILKANLKIKKEYAYAHAHNLYRVQQKLFGKKIVPNWISNINNHLWTIYEKQKIALYTLFAIGILAKKE